jgi:endonuclease/exonuclease/phosphatase (EEP) superfamily protein YafD
LAVVYRPPGPYSLFVDEFSDFAADLATYTYNILLIGDFNIHVNNPSDALARAFLPITDTLGFKQLVQHPTHIGGNTLDLVLPRGVDISQLVVSTYTSALSDHFAHFAHFPGGGILPLRRSASYFQLSLHHTCNHHSYGR